MAVAITAAEFVASTRCASEVLRVQHRVWPLYLRKHGQSRQRSEPLQTVAQGLAENLTNVAATAETLGNWSGDSDLAEEAVDQLIEFLEWSEASLLQQRKVIEAFVEGRRADDITRAFKRVLQLFDCRDWDGSGGALEFHDCRWHSSARRRSQIRKRRGTRRGLP